MLGSAVYQNISSKMRGGAIYIFWIVGDFSLGGGGTLPPKSNKPVHEL